MRALGNRKWRAALPLAGVLLVTLGAVLFQQPHVAWNSGARERLSAALRKIETELRERRTSPQEFMPRTIDNVGERQHDADLLAQRHGVTCRWRGAGRDEEVVFYPLAVSRQVLIHPRSTTVPQPQLVMVPLDLADRESLPNLHECTKAAVKETWECHLREVRRRLAQHGMTHAATLMSDGTVVFLEVERLTESAGTGRSVTHGE